MNIWESFTKFYIFLFNSIVTSQIMKKKSALKNSLYPQTPFLQSVHAIPK